jgi:hypothetical protein
MSRGTTMSRPPSAWPRRARRAGPVLALAAGVWLGVAGPRCAAAQTRTVIDGPIGYRSWTIGAGLVTEEFHASQFVVPVSVHAQLGPRVDLTTSISAAGSSLDPVSGSTTQLNGASSVMSQLFFRFADDHALLQTGVTLPTGTHALRPSEVGVWEVMSLPVLGFPLRHYGRGLEWSGGFGLARRLGERGSGSLGAGFVLRAPYELIDGHTDYRPPPEFSVTTGIDLGARAEGSATRPLRLDLTYRVLGTHQEGGRKVLREGSQLELQASGSLEKSRFVAAASLRAVTKGDYLPYDASGRELDRLQGSSGTSLSTRLTCARRLGTASRLGIAGEWNLLRNSSGYAQNGRAFGLGPCLDFPLGSLFDLQLEAAYLWGSLDGAANAADIDLHGTSVVASLRWGTGK